MRKTMFFVAAFLIGVMAGIAELPVFSLKYFAFCGILDLIAWVICFGTKL